jgi:hypothetical protein
MSTHQPRGASNDDAEYSGWRAWERGGGVDFRQLAEEGGRLLRHPQTTFSMTELPGRRRPIAHFDTFEGRL